MSVSPVEQLARQKVGLAIRMLEDAAAAYAELGYIYGHPALNVEILQPVIDELSARLAEADLLSSSVG